MATVRATLLPGAHSPMGSGFPQPIRQLGTNFPVPVLAFDATTTETAHFQWTAFSYGTGNVTCEIIWYSAAATSGVVRWEAAIAAITPESDSQDSETKAFATAATVDDTHLGTTAKRLHTATVTITAVDSLAAGDEVFLKVSRLGGHANDTIAGDVLVEKVRLSYSDT